jgi:hypothetical protein
MCMEEAFIPQVYDMEVKVIENLFPKINPSPSYLSISYFMFFCFIQFYHFFFKNLKFINFFHLWFSCLLFFFACL